MKNCENCLYWKKGHSKKGASGTCSFYGERNLPVFIKQGSEIPISQLLFTLKFNYCENHKDKFKKF